MKMYYLAALLLLLTPYAQAGDPKHHCKVKNVCAKPDPKPVIKPCGCAMPEKPNELLTYLIKLFNF